MIEDYKNGKKSAASQKKGSSKMLESDSDNQSVITRKAGNQQSELLKL
jgi:hypothetical protein